MPSSAAPTSRGSRQSAQKATKKTISRLSVLLLALHFGSVVGVVLFIHVMIGQAAPVDGKPQVVRIKESATSWATVEFAYGVASVLWLVANIPRWVRWALDRWYQPGYQAIKQWNPQPDGIGKMFGKYLSLATDRRCQWLIYLTAKIFRTKKRTKAGEEVELEEQNDWQRMELLSERAQHGSQRGDRE